MRCRRHFQYLPSIAAHIHSPLTYIYHIVHRTRMFCYYISNRSHTEIRYMTETQEYTTQPPHQPIERSHQLTYDTKRATEIVRYCLLLQQISFSRRRFIVVLRMIFVLRLDFGSNSVIIFARSARIVTFSAISHCSYAAFAWFSVHA